MNPTGNPGKQPMRTPSRGEGTSSNTSRTSDDASSSKVDALLAAAPRLTLEDQDLEEPPSYDDANSIQSGSVTLQSSAMVKQNGPNNTVDDAVDFRWAFDIAPSHEELMTNVVRHPNAKGTVLSITRLALGPRRAVPNNPLQFNLNATPLSANQLEVHAKVNFEQGIKSINIGMLDIPEDDPDIQFGIIDWANRLQGLALPDIFFEPSYPMPPDVLCFLNSFGWRGSTPRKIKIMSRGGGQHGFHPQITTGYSSVLPLDLKAAWVAIPKDTQRFDSGYFDVISKPSQPMGCFNGTVTFTKYKFPKKRPPKIFFGFSAVEIDSNRPFRCSVSVTGQSHEGFSWTVRNWDDVVLGQVWSAGVSWIAVAT